MRAQANLPALAVALLVVTTTTGLAVTVADGAFAGSSRDASERRTAVALAARLVSPGSPLTDRANVVNRSAAATFDRDDLDALAPGRQAVEIALSGATLAIRGAPTGGTTFRRVVLVERRAARTVEPMIHENRTTLPRRTPRIRLVLQPPPGTTVGTVRANERVILHNTTGLHGTFSVRVSRFETTTLSFNASGPLPRGSVRLTYYPARTTKATLEVTVDA